jgi:hypothetical protein
MVQQVLALGIILFMLAKLLVQKRKKQVGKNEFFFWLLFWILAAAAILSLKEIDKFLATFGFSTTGIDFLQYVSILILFSLIFKMRLKIEKLERNITKIVRETAIKE